MNIYTFDIYITQCILVEDTNEKRGPVYCYDYVEIGPLNMPEPSRLDMVKDAIHSISSTPLASNWWTEFSSWDDNHRILSSGSTLSIHSVVSKINNRLQSIENAICSINEIDENGNIIIYLFDEFPTLWQEFKITAKRKQLRTLKQISAYNVSKCITSENEIQKLELPHCLYKLVSMFLDTYSGDYISE